MIVYRGKVCSEESLFYPRPEGDWNDEKLFLLLHVAERRDQKLPARFLPDLLPFILHEPGEGVHEDRHYEGGQEGEDEEDACNGVDTGEVLGLLEVVGDIHGQAVLLAIIGVQLHYLGGTVAGAAGGEDLLGDGELRVQVGGEHGRTDDVAHDGVALEEEEEYSEELDHDRLGVDVIYGRQSVSNLG